jgi:hypothetical protein
VEAGVEKCIDLARIVAGNQDRVFSHVGGEEVSLVLDLALVSQKEPISREDALHLHVIYVLVNEDAAIDPAAFILDQAFNLKLPNHERDLPFPVLSVSLPWGSGIGLFGTTTSALPAFAGVQAGGDGSPTWQW